MTYDEAMAAIRGEGSGNRQVTRSALGRPLVLRFGYPAMVMRPGRFIAFTPTYEDLHASDWEIVERESEES